MGTRVKYGLVVGGLVAREFLLPAEQPLVAHAGQSGPAGGSPEGGDKGGDKRPSDERDEDFPTGVVGKRKAFNLRGHD